MYDYVQKEKELLAKLNGELNDLKIFMLGNVVREETENNVKSSECLQDDIVNNINTLDYALKQVDVISTAIKGGKK